MHKEVSLDELWDSAAFGAKCVFEPDSVAELPEGARRYIEHAIAPGAPLASAVRLRMHGEIKLRGWLPFTADQVIHRDHGLIWAASVSMHGLPILGSDRVLDGEGAMRWKLAGLIPVMTASGPQISRSAIGRFQAESVWLPSMLCANGVTWTSQDPSHARVRFAVWGETTELVLGVNDDGRLETLKLARWGNPDGGDYRYVDFGVFADQENTFDGYTIPTRVRAGWYIGTERFEREGEFFRAAVDDAKYR